MLVSVQKHWISGQKVPVPRHVSAPSPCPASPRCSAAVLPHRPGARSDPAHGSARFSRIPGRRDSWRSPAAQIPPAWQEPLEASPELMETCRQQRDEQCPRTEPGLSSPRLGCGRAGLCSRCMWGQMSPCDHPAQPCHRAEPGPSPVPWAGDHLHPEGTPRASPCGFKHPGNPKS